MTTTEAEIRLNLAALIQEKLQVTDEEAQQQAEHIRAESFITADGELDEAAFDEFAAQIGRAPNEPETLAQARARFGKPPTPAPGSAEAERAAHLERIHNRRHPGGSTDALDALNRDRFNRR